MSRTDEIDKIVDEIGDADSLYEFAEGIYEDRQRIEELEEQLKNAIVPKFKIGQEVWCVKFMKIIKFKINKIEIYRGEAEEENRILYGNWEDMTYQIEENCFATKEEAQAKLEELKGENK